MLLRMFISLKTQIFPTGVCRYQPTCSQYAIDAFTKFPAHKAIYLVFIRLVKCNPLFYGGVDSLPGPNSKEKVLL